jgi:hypothetical protein
MSFVKSPRPPSHETAPTVSLGGNAAPARQHLSTHFRGRITIGSRMLLAFGTCLLGCTLLPTHAADITAPAMNWALPFFTKEGHHAMTARGSEMRYINANHVEVIDLNLTVFSGDAAAKVETILLSPAATFLPNDRIARGEKSVRFIGDDIEASGRQWTYWQQEKKISLQGDVRVTFRAELKNLLQ